VKTILTLLALATLTAGMLNERPSGRV